jgi:hypothetical protein
MKLSATRVPSLGSTRRMVERGAPGLRPRSIAVLGASERPSLIVSAQRIEEQADTER